MNQFEYVLLRDKLSKITTIKATKEFAELVWQKLYIMGSPSYERFPPGEFYKNMGMLSSCSRSPSRYKTDAYKIL